MTSAQTDETKKATVTALDRPNCKLVAALASLVAASAALLALASPAGALTGHVFSSSFGTSGSGDGQVSSPQGVAVSAATGDRYVADTGNARVDEFDSSGAFVRAFGANVGGSGVNVCTSGCVAGTPGTGPGALTTPTFIAADNSGGPSEGDVYVGDTTDNVVTKFDASGGLIATWGTGGQLNGSTATSPAGPFGGLAGLAVDLSGNLFVYDTSANMFKFAQDATPGTGFNSHFGVTPAGIAVDSSDNLYVVRGTPVVEKLSVTGTTIGQVTDDSDFSSTTGLAIDPATDQLYVDDAGSKIRHYTDTTCAASSNCTAADSFGSSELSSAAGIAVDGSNTSVDAADTANQRVAVFTAVTLPDATTNPPTGMTPVAATLNGHLDPAGGGNTTDCHFDYTDDASFQAKGFTGAQTAPCAEGNVQSAATDVHADISALTPATTYHVRLSVANSSGANPAPSVSFTTPPAVQLSTGSATNIATTGATLNGTLNPGGLPLTDCRFDYTDDTTFQAQGYAGATSVPCSQSLAAIGSGTSDVPVSAAVNGLTPGTFYHFRLEATNGDGTTLGQDQTFGTPGAGFGIKSFSFKVLDQNGQPYTQAGGHPYALQTEIDFNTTVDQSGNVTPDDRVKDITVSLPPGLVGDAGATPTCSNQDLFADTCPASTQIGVLRLVTASPIQLPLSDPLHRIPVYNVQAPANLPAQFGFFAAPVSAFIDTHVRTGSDYGLDSQILNISTQLPVLGSKLTLWGDPYDPAHNVDRLCTSVNSQHYGCAVPSPQTALLTNPTSCSGPQTVTVKADSWQDRGAFVGATDTLPAVTGCDKLEFKPSFSLQPDTTVADSPSGLNVELKMPSTGLTDPNGLSDADLKKAVVTLPPGFTVNPAAANGLAACTPAQIGLDNASEPSCPDASKVGTAEIHSPLLPDPLEGSLYVASPYDNPFGTLLAGYLVAEADGVLIKLPGRFDTDPTTGQITATFDNNPQLPFDDLKLQFFGGPRGILATPESCGTFSTASSLTPWNGASAAVSTDPFAITSGCLSGFQPTLTAGTQNAQAGSYSPFVLSLSRTDVDENFSGLSVTLPPGMLAKLAGVAECSDAQLASISSQPGTGANELANPSCPAASQVGAVTTGAGVGPDPFFISGKAYLTGPYKGAPYGLAVVVPAIAGPYDLGTVVVRQALYVDPTTAQVTDVSDPFPTILDGIPLRIRRIDVNINRPGFTVNPTSCDPLSVTATATSTQGTQTPLSSRFQVGGCSSLAFSPRLSMQLTGKGRTRSGEHPTLISTLTQSFGQANLHDVKVALPLSMALDPLNSQHVCNYDTAQAVHGGAVGCPAGTIVGSATAVTPLLSQPLTGNVYLVQGIRFNQRGQRIRTLPTLLIPLRGQIALDLRAATSVNGAQQLVTTFATIPDAAVSKFTLTIAGGAKGILVVTGRGRTICGKPQVTNAALNAQSGKTEAQNITMSKPACAGYHKTTTHKHKTRGKK